MLAGAQFAKATPRAPTDVIGHLYGPFSRESHEALARLDAELGAFLALLEERVGKGRLLVALSSDHGVLPLPEWLDKHPTTIAWRSHVRAGSTFTGLRDSI